MHYLVDAIHPRRTFRGGRADRRTDRLPQLHPHLPLLPASLLFPTMRLRIQDLAVLVLLNMMEYTQGATYVVDEVNGPYNTIGAALTAITGDGAGDTIEVRAGGWVHHACVSI